MVCSVPWISAESSYANPESVDRQGEDRPALGQEQRGPYKTVRRAADRAGSTSGAKNRWRSCVEAHQNVRRLGDRNLLDGGNLLVLHHDVD